MQFDKLVQKLFCESPDNLIYQGESFGFDSEKGNPITFFISSVVIRPDIKKGYDSDIASSLGLSIVYVPTHISAEKLEKAYLEDPANKFFTHWNLSSILNYNEVYSYDELKELGIKVFSFKTDDNAYFEKVRKKYPRMAFALKGDEEAIPLKYRGRIWKKEDKFIVSTWEFNKQVAEKYLIPFMKQAFNASEDQIIFEVKAGQFVSAQNVGSADHKILPHEKEIGEMLAALHMATGPDKDRIREELKELLAKYSLDPKLYGISDEILKSSAVTAQKILGSAKPTETVAKIKASQQTSENLFVNLCKAILLEDKVKRDRCLKKADEVYGKKTSAHKSGAVVKCRQGKIWKKRKKK